MVNWKLWRILLIATLIAVAFFNLGLSSILDATLQTEPLKGVSVQLILGIASIVGAVILWKLGGPGIWRWTLLAIFALIAIFNLGLSSVINMNLDSVVFGTLKVQTALGFTAIVGLWALFKRL